uniref:Cytochrome P450 CYP333B8 n=1 Tax=Zygaena filipendulae TaxID=287375 RepID=D2JLK5_9NEOP|nr:cytochrome P450 CYP333B8 [Zygaena filipendulae]
MVVNRGLPVYRSTTVNASSVKENHENIKLASKTWDDIPGPSSLPFIGQLIHYLPGGSFYGPQSEVMEKLMKQYGPIVKIVTFGAPTVVTLFDADAIELVLRNENWMPDRPGFDSLEYYRKYYNKTKEQSTELTGLLTDHGENWRLFRSKVNSAMLQPKTIKLYTSTIDKVALDMVERIKSIRDDSDVMTRKFDMEMNLWALESIGVVALGTRLNCFDPNLAENSPERQLIRCVHDFFITSNELDFKPNLWKYFATRKFKKAMKLYEKQESLTNYFVQRAIKEMKSNSIHSSEKKGVLEKLMDIDEKIAVIMACDMLFAGVDTTANTMIATLYLLAVNNEKQNILRDEIRSNQERRPYLKACIKEGMRMMPITSGNMRRTTKEYNLLGYQIPKGSFIAFMHQILCLRENQFPRPKEFIPERWTAEKSDPLYYGNAHSFAYIPFGFGARSCIGRRIAELEVETLLARIIENFHVEWTGPPPQVKSNALNYITGPFHFKFKDV